MREKPRIDRDEVRRQENRARNVRRVAREAVRLLKAGEDLSRPVRKDDEILIRVGRAKNNDRPKVTGDEEARPLFTAWFEAEVL